MLSLVRDELKAEVRSLDHRLQAGFLRTQADSQRLEASSSKMLLLLEEQNANNRIVLESLQALWQRQDRIEWSSL